MIAEDETKETDNNLSLSNLDSSPGTSGHKGHDSSGNFHLQMINHETGVFKYYKWCTRG